MATFISKTATLGWVLAPATGSSPQHPLAVGSGVGGVSPQPIHEERACGDTIFDNSEY